MQQITNGNLLEIIDLANSLRQEHLFIANEQNAFNNLNDTLKRNSSNVAQVRHQFVFNCVYSFCYWLLVVLLIEQCELLKFMDDARCEKKWADTSHDWIV